MLVAHNFLKYNTTENYADLECNTLTVSIKKWDLGCLFLNTFQIFFVLVLASVDLYAVYNGHVVRFHQEISEM